MNDKLKAEKLENKMSKRFSRGIKAFGRRYFSFGSKSFWRKRKYDKKLRQNSPAFQLFWLIILIILLIFLNNENKIYILYVFIPIYLIMLIWEIWVMGAPEKDDKQE